jgi:hypothetical protein
VTRDDKAEAADCSPAMLFGVLWETLNDIMGSAATATLVRRAVKHASSRSPGLDGLAITRERFEYRYALPESWTGGSAVGLSALQGLTRELQPLLVELTGAVVLHRLRSVRELERCGLFRAEVDQ